MHGNEFNYDKQGEGDATERWNSWKTKNIER